MNDTITVKELELLLKTSKVILIDVRSAIEFAELHIPDAINVPIEQIEKNQFQPDEGLCLITICASGGGRSKRAATILRQQFNNPVYTLSGGVFDWYSKETLAH